MELHAKLVRSQLSFFKPFVAGLSLEVTRKGQDKLGELMTALHRREVLVRDHDFGAFQGAWVMPKDQRRSGVILYLHGGGYTCGSLDYAKGFAATLANASQAEPSLQVIPEVILKVFPYVVTLLALIFFSKTTQAPRAAGEPFEKGKR